MRKYGEITFRSISKAIDVKEKEREKERKLVITMASYVLQTPPRVAHGKLPKTMASFTSVRNHRCSRQAAWTNKVSENIGQLRLQPPPRVAHASRLNQQWPATFINATTCGAHKLSGPKKEGWSFEPHSSLLSVGVL